MRTDILDAHSSQLSWLRRLRYTPLRDVLRGRLSGRLDVAGRIASSDLPAGLRTCVEEVVRRTRLWRSEKVDVAEELITHFADGLAAGTSVESLLTSFGDRTRAARLIRRAKKRNRSLLWRGPVRTAQVTLATLAIVYLVLLVRVNVGSVHLARDYIEEMNALALAVPDEQRAWPVYRRATLSVTQWPALLSSNDAHPDSPRWAQLVELVRANEQALQQFREAAGRAAMGFVVGMDPDVELLRCFDEHAPVTVDPSTTHMAEGAPMVMQVALPHARPMRSGARLLAIDARLAAVEGDAERFLADTGAMLGMSEHLGETRFVICDLVSLTIATETTQMIRQIVWDHPGFLSAKQLADVAHRLSALRGGQPFRVSFAGERASFEDVVQRLSTDDGSGNGHLTAERLPPRDLVAGASSVPRTMVSGGVLIMPFVSVFVVDRRELMRRYEEHLSRIEAWDALPLWERDAFDPDAEFERSLPSGSWQFMRYWPLAVLFPSLTRASVLGQLTTQERDATLVVIALDLYRRDHGAWPESLQALTPRYLPSVPPDRQDGKPLRYRLVDGRPMLYSLGIDRDDDDGREPLSGGQGQYQPEWAKLSDLQRIMSDPRYAPKNDGDALFWPPAR